MKKILNKKIKNINIKGIINIINDVRVINRHNDFEFNLKSKYDNKVNDLLSHQYNDYIVENIIINNNKTVDLVISINKCQVAGHRCQEGGSL